MSPQPDRRGFEEEPPPVIRDKRKFDPDGNLRRPGTESPGAPAGGPGVGAGGSEAGAASASSAAMSQDDVDEQVRLLDLQTQLDERTSDLQRLTAEYANYRKRVDRDRIAVSEVATGRVLEAFLPVLDDIERAAAHGDLNGPFKTVADKVIGGLTKLGLEPFGQVGDEFDPVLHEAVTHEESSDVAAPTATMVMRRGYRLGERLLRPALVGVTAPASSPTAEAQSSSATPNATSADGEPAATTSEG